MDEGPIDMNIYSRSGLFMFRTLEKEKKHTQHCDFDQLEKGSMTPVAGKNGKWQNMRLEIWHNHIIMDLRL